MFSLHINFFLVTDTQTSSINIPYTHGIKQKIQHYQFSRQNIHTQTKNSGGFEEQMTRKEAALILGVRESSTPKRIKEAHRKLLILNHPDTGGSTYMAGKINEAKELLLQGKKM